jgi:hypothetical protein
MNCVCTLVGILVGLLTQCFSRAGSFDRILLLLETEYCVLLFDDESSLSMSQRKNM